MKPLTMWRQLTVTATTTAEALALAVALAVSASVTAAKGSAVSWAVELTFRGSRPVAAVGLGAGVMFR